MLDNNQEMLDMLSLEDCLFLSQNGFSIVISDGKIVLIKEERKNV